MADGVLADDYGRQDIELARGATRGVGGLWLQDRGEGFRPVDLTGWRCRLVLYAPDGRQWYEQECQWHGSDGKAVANIPADAFTGPEWDGRTTGDYRIEARDGDLVEIIGWGHWVLIR